MRWIHDYQLFLFDFDGLLVNTEELHFLAYQRMCADRGFSLNWDFDRYCQAAHYGAEALELQIYQEFPSLKAMEPDWKVLYAEKKKEIMRLLSEDAVNLMPGVDRLLLALQDAGIKRCVVTHSPDELVAVARRKHPVLNTIPFWVTREQYSHPKPHPECYLKAVRMYAEAGECVIGFEDTPRGITALMQTPIKPVMICTAHYPEIPLFKGQGVSHFSTLDAIPADSRL